MHFENMKTKYLIFRDNKYKKRLKKMNKKLEQQQKDIESLRNALK